jgi:hypothetical protein
MMSKWKNKHVDPKQWVEISYVVFSFAAITVHSMINISANHACKAKANIDVSDNNLCAL